jgi:hypothetical protein
MTEITENYETEARVNALRQLLDMTQGQVLRAYEGLMTLPEYVELKENRRMWKEELDELTGETLPEGSTSTPDVLRAAADSRDVSAIAFVALAQSAQLDDVTVAEHAALFPEWDEHWTGKAGTILRDGGELYRSIHDVGAGQNTKPGGTPAMWTRIGNPAEEWPEWIQPIGAHDAYPEGAKVSRGGKHWVSGAGGNIWEPGVYGWAEYTEGVG